MPNWREQGSKWRSRRGITLMWSLAALALALAMTPIYVSMCHSLARSTARGAHRLVAIQRGAEELERLRAEGPSAAGRSFSVPELAEGKATLTLTPLPGRRVRQADLEITWKEDASRGRVAWTTLLR